MTKFKHLKLTDDTEPELSQAAITRGCCARHILGADLFVEFYADNLDLNSVGRWFCSISHLQGAYRFCTQGGKFSPLFFQAVVIAMSFSKCLAGYQCELLYILVGKSLTLANPWAVTDSHPWEGGGGEINQSLYYDIILTCFQYLQ